ILAPNADPHEYEPRPDDVVATADARIVFENGDNLDAWMSKVISDSGSDAKVVDLGRSVPVKRPGESTGPEASRYDRHGWHGPGKAGRAAHAIATQLGRADPRHRAAFRRNAGRYEARLHRLDGGIERCIDRVPPSRRMLVTDHDAFGYFANRYGIDVVGAVIPSQTIQAQPSAEDVSALAKLIAREHVAAIFPEHSLSPSLAHTIAAQTGADADHSLYGDTLGPSGSSGDTYLRMERANANEIVTGLTAGRRGCRIGGIG